MSKFTKLAELNKEINLLEAYGDYKSADILHKKFMKEAQYMPMTMMPQMMPQMMPMVNPMMMARPMMPVAPAARPVAPVVQAPTPQQAPAPTTTPAPASSTVNPTGIKPGTPPSPLTRNTNQQGQGGFVQDGSGKITIFGQDGKPISYVAPPGSTLGQGLSTISPGPSDFTPPVSRIIPPTPIQNQRFDGYAQKLTGTFNTVDDPKKLQEFRKNIKTQLDKELFEKRLTQEQYDQLMDQLYGN